MPRSIPYHLNEGTHSLAYATPEESDLPQPEETDEVREYTFLNETIYCLYTPTGNSYTPEATETEITGSDSPIIYAIQQIQQDLQTNTDFTEWKEPEYGAIQQSLQKVQWKQSRSEVAADLISSLVLRHPFPNGNHRTSISLAVLYLTEVCPEFTIENTSQFEELTNRFITDSKKILTVRRNNVPFRILKKAGATHMERKGGIQIDLSKFNLDVENPYSKYENIHYERTHTYITELLTACGGYESGEKKDGGKRQFAEKLRY